MLLDTVVLYLYNSREQPFHYDEWELIEKECLCYQHFRLAKQ